MAYLDKAGLSQLFTGLKARFVDTKAQTLTAAQQAQVRANIDAAADTHEYTGTLTVAGWATAVPYTQVLSVAGVAADSSVVVSPAPASWKAYGDAGVRATLQAAGTLTFTAERRPTKSLSVSILVILRSGGMTDAIQHGGRQRWRTA